MNVMKVSKEGQLLCPDCGGRIIADQNEHCIFLFCENCLLAWFTQYGIIITSILIPRVK